MRNFILSALFLLCLNSIAQEEKKDSTSCISKLKGYNLGVNYFGNNAIVPGISLRLSKDFASFTKEKIKTKKGIEITKTRTSYFEYGLQLSSFYAPKTQTAFITSLDINYKRIGYRGFIFQTSLGIGHYMSFLPETYKVDDNGNVKRQYFAAKHYFTPVWSHGIGHTIKKSKLIEDWHLNINVLMLAPYNSFVLPMINLELGTTLNL